MDLLFTLDERNYEEGMPVLERHAVRAVICKNGKYVMQKSKFGDFKMPGGGIEKGETYLAALMREVREETGLIIKPASVKEVGETLERRIDCFNKEQIYEAHSYFYICDVEEETVEVKMTASEVKLGYHPEWETLDEIIRVNEEYLNDYWQKRDYQFLVWYREHKEEFE